MYAEVLDLIREEREKKKRINQISKKKNQAFLSMILYLITRGSISQRVDEIPPVYRTPMFLGRPRRTDKYRKQKK
ncbi:hypothetical protein PDE_05719 [Penicillium oxalicum 114-2]|uniref:Uncharacterized protein n=1 Tax=Penicillium oxalicum (strain 114-2 / CGMCC 5302) TaxID=933388 RepID=S8B7R3_PENO1|nr:hypothetical protein PDE_05719 [Penicillium oxalicum 114-2]